MGLKHKILSAVMTFKEGLFRLNNGAEKLEYILISQMQPNKISLGMSIKNIGLVEDIG